MCGRTACTLCSQNIIKANTYKSRNGSQVFTPQSLQLSDYKASYNQSPGQTLPVLVLKRLIDKSCDNNEERVVAGMRWGLIPDWHSGDANQFKWNTINCRVEDMRHKKTFSGPLNRGQRCVVLVEGFFEWKTNKDNTKEPYFFYFPQNDVDFKNREKWMSNESEFCVDNQWRGPRLLTIAGLFNSKKCNASEDQLLSFTIITVESHSNLKFIHNRMPAILDSEEDVRDWLDFENVSVDEALKLLVPFNKLEFHAVSKAVGNVRNNTIDNILPIKTTQKQKTIDHWFKSISTSNKCHKNTSLKAKIEAKDEINEDNEDNEGLTPKKMKKET